MARCMVEGSVEDIDFVNLFSLPGYSPRGLLLPHLACSVALFFTELFGVVEQWVGKVLLAGN